MLEYLYTDFAEKDDKSVIDLLILADEYCLPQLINSCELYLTLHIGSLITRSIDDLTNEIDIVDLLHKAKVGCKKSKFNWRRYQEACLHRRL